jgi:4-amino-4-deoxy-L-arabinose transferase-like glycosyltransferase
MRFSHKLFFLLLIVALLLRLTAGWAWQSRLTGRFGLGDSEGYWALGLDIAEGKPYEYGQEHGRVFRTPGYPLLLAPIFDLAGDTQTAILLARAEAALLGTLAVACVWWLAKLLFDERTALLAAALATFYPGAIVLSALILSEAPFCPLMLLQFALWTLAWRAKTLKKATFSSFCGGLAAGAATLMRPSWLLFTPLAAMVLCIHPRPMLASRDTIAARALMASCMILGLVEVMFPWWIRNIEVTGHFVPTTLQVGASLYDGLNPNATGASNMDFVSDFVAQEQKAGLPAGKTGSRDSLELRLDRRFRNAALAWAWANPGQAMQLAGVKFLRMWNIWPNEARLSSWSVRLVVLFTYTPLLFFAIIGAWRTIDRGWPYLLCWLPAVYFTLLHVVFVSSIRYREPAMLALLVLAAGGILGIRDWGFGISGCKTASDLRTDNKNINVLSNP